MNILVTSVVLVMLAGCTTIGGAKFSSEHGYCVQGQFDDGRFAGAGCPTIVPDGFNAMGSRKHNPDGTVDEDMFSTIVGSDGSSATGRAATIVAETGRLQQKMLICAIAPNSAACLN